MYRSYCNERGCPGHVKNWESCRELRAFAGSTAPGSWMDRTGGAVRANAAFKAGKTGAAGGIRQAFAVSGPK